MADDSSQQIQISDNPLEALDKQDNIELVEIQDDTPSTAKQAKHIQAIDKTSVHKICSGQVVLTIATAVKELVENSIDAGATNVEIKLKEFGSESIEVSDNGDGVEEVNFEGLTLKHHTSKLQDFDDLVNVTTFGFRGEALSSLCALSKMTIVTRHKTAAVGTKLEFDLSGRIMSKKSAPRQVGTTVHIENIFHTLPVRHKEFQKNVKKEFSKLVQVLNAYCIINTGVRISCYNQTGKGSRSAVVTTNGNVSMRDNISNVFGQKQLSSLLEFHQSEPQDDVCEDFGIKPQQKPGVKFLIEGFVSKCEHGQGRGSTDRQFIFINKRPCDSSKILKIVNEVYHGYNRHQYPFIVLSISMDKDSVDVNVTPDKRQIFVEGEPFLLAVIKTSLIQMYEPTSSVYKMNNILSPPHEVTSESSLMGNERMSESTESLFGNSAGEQKMTSSESLSNSLAKLKRSFSSAFARGSTNQEVGQLKKSKNTFLSSKSLAIDRSSITHFFNKSSMKSKSGIPETNFLDSEKTDSLGDCSHSLDSSLVADEVFEKEHCDSFVSETTLHHNVNIETSDITETRTTCSNKDSNVSLLQGLPSSDVPVFLYTPKASCASPANHPDQAPANGGLKISFHKLSSDCDAVSEDGDTVSINVISREASNGCGGQKLQTESDNIGCRSPMDTNPVVFSEVDTEPREDHNYLEKTIPFSIAKLKRNMEALKLSDSDRSSSFSRCFRAKINPADNFSAEDELNRAISKDMFSKMEILGQFNLGFIITKLDSDLFIIDQHATDEKYNFEMLQRSTVLQSQKLLCPKTIELTASNEAILVDNLEVFKKNGFDFLVDEEALPTQRVKLISAPVSKNWLFGKDDIEELIFMLTDSPNVMCRPTRVRLMFASRACRKSVMIGTALSQSEMRRLVNHMGELDQPWNCPHGRPTMRHLFNMEMLPT